MTGRKIRDLASQAMQNRWFSYGSIFLLQLKIVWGVWLLRDLTIGDTSQYFVAAWDWYRELHVHMAWSPLYTAFHGILLHLSPDAYVVTTLLRLIAVLTLSVLILVLMRRLLPPGIAWLMTAWWVVLPIDFDAMYEHHLIAVIPVVVALLTIVWKPGPWGRGCCVAILLSMTILMRNELLPGALLFAVLAIGWDLRRKHAGLWRAYGIPLAVACLVVLFFYARSSDDSRRFTFSRKHTENVCLMFAFDYQQKHPDWKGSSWFECEKITTRLFGVPELSLAGALRRNPRVTLEHFWWNLQLVPNGLQVLLFNCMSGSITPDYIPSPSRFWTALLATLVTLAIAVGGLAILWSNRKYWWEFWLQERIWVWVAMACLAIGSMIVMIGERPRPSYIFTLGIALRALVGTCLFAIGSRFPRLQRLQPALPAAIVIAILLAPSYYSVTNPGGVRPLHDIYERLAPFQSRLEKPGAGLAAIGAFELCQYLGRSAYLGGPGACRALDTNGLRLEVTPETPWGKILDKYGATLFYADDAVMADPLGRQFVSGAGSNGWHLGALHDEPGQNWAVLERTEAPAVAAPAVLPTAVDIVARDSGITLGKGWYPYEIFGGERFRWVNNDAEVIVQGRDTGPVSLRLDVQPGPSLDGKPLSLQAFGNGKKLEVVNSPKGRTVTIRLPGGNMEVRLHVDSANRVTLGDPRILNFRVFKISAP